MFIKTGSITLGERVSIENWRKLVVAASIKQDPKEIDTQASFEFDDKNFIYVRSRAVSAGEYHGPNGNGDFFPEAELRENYKTFIRRGVYLNHDSDDVMKAVGIILDAKYWDQPDTNYVECLMAVDASHPVADKILKGIMNSTSMGAIVDRCECNICNKIATNENEYCDHLRNYMGKMYNNKKVYAINRGVNFYEDSFVGTPADKEAQVLEVLNKAGELVVTAAAKKLAEKFEKLADDYQKKVGDEHRCWNCKGEGEVYKGTQDQQKCSVCGGTGKPKEQKKEAGKTSKCIKCEKSLPVEEMVDNEHGAGKLCKECAENWNKEAAPSVVDPELNDAVYETPKQKKEKSVDIDTLTDKIVTVETKKQLMKDIADKVREQLRKFQPKELVDKSLTDEEILEAVRQELSKDLKQAPPKTSSLQETVGTILQEQEDSKKPIDIGDGYSVAESGKVAGYMVLQLIDRGKVTGLYTTRHADGLSKEAIQQYYRDKFSITASTTKPEIEPESKNKTEDITMVGRLTIKYLPGTALENSQFIARKGNLEVVQVASNLLNEATQKAIVASEQRKKAAGKVQMGVGDYDSTKGKVDHKIEEGKEKADPASLTKNLGAADTTSVNKEYCATDGKYTHEIKEGGEPIQPSAVVNKYASLIGGKVIKSAEDNKSGVVEVVVEGGSIARLAQLWKTRTALVKPEVKKEAKISGTGPEGWAKETYEPVEQDPRDTTDMLARETPPPVEGAKASGALGSEQIRYYSGWDKGTLSGNGDGWARKVATLQAKLKEAASKITQAETENKMLKATLEKTKKRAEDEKKGQLIGAIMQRMAETGALNPTPEAIMELKEQGLDHEDASVKATAEASNQQKAELASLDIAALEKMADMINRFGANTRKAELELPKSLDIPIISRGEESSESLEDKLAASW